MVQYMICPGLTFGFVDNPVEDLSKRLSLLVGRSVPPTVTGACNKDNPWFDDQ